MGGILGILDGGRMGWVVGIRTGSSISERLVYPGVGASEMGPGHLAMAVVGRNAHPGVGLTRNGGDAVAGVGRPNDDTVDMHAARRWLSWGAPHPGSGASGRAPGRGSGSFRVVGLAGCIGGASRSPVRYAWIAGGVGMPES